jgi:glutaredoxin
MWKALSTTCLLFLSRVAVFAALLCAPAYAAVPATTDNKSARSVELVIFWEPGCPYCQRAKDWLAGLPETKDWLQVREINIDESKANQDMFLKVTRAFAIARPGVPLIVAGERPFLGFGGADKTGAAILEALDACRAGGCKTLAQVLAAPLPPVITPPLAIALPFFGTVRFSDLSLPGITVLLAAVDGFNPCAMWVLVFLIGLLVGMQDRARMWLLGGAFLATSGIVYFAFLAAWLNAFLLLGAIPWVRLAVGIVALASGGWYLYSFATNAAAECKVTNLDQRRRIMDALRGAVYEKRFLLALGGIMMLAAAVNLIELLCSAGIPAVFTDVLVLNDLPLLQYYGYLLLYVGVFMLDDAIIFATAMLTLKATGMTNRYLRVSHFIGGAAMLAIGLLLIFAPGWLAFGT